MATLKNTNVTSIEAATLVDATTKLDGKLYKGVDAIKWDLSMEGAEEYYGSSELPLGETRGSLKTTLEFEMELGEFELFTSRLGGAFMEKRWNFQTNIQRPGGRLITLAIGKCRIIGASSSLERGKPNTVAVKCSVTGDTTLNGKKATLGSGSASSAGGDIASAAAGAVASATAGFSIGI